MKGLDPGSPVSSPSKLAHERAFDPGILLPRRFPARVWFLAALAFLTSYGFMWSYVHVLADMRPCGLRLDDPMFRLIPKDDRWYWVSKQLYTALTVGAVGLLGYHAVRGDQRPLVRWGVALSMQAVLRSVTITLLPLCRFPRPAGTIVLKEVPTLDLGFVEIPWRVYAANDLVFSGHVGEFLLLTWATRGFPRALRVVLIVFQILQVFALLGTRGHYTIDIFLALPCAFFADAVAVRLLYWLSPRPNPQIALT